VAKKASRKTRWSCSWPSRHNVGPALLLHPARIPDQGRKVGRRYSSTRLPGDELDDAVQSVGALKRVVIYDTCQSAGGDSGPHGEGPVCLSRALERMSRATGSFTIAATAATDAAHEVQQLKHGVLTYALLAGLGL